MKQSTRIEQEGKDDILEVMDDTMLKSKMVQPLYFNSFGCPIILYPCLSSLG